VQDACRDDRVPYLACRGFLSQSEAYDAGKRFQRYRRNGQQPVVFYLGDHDASGIDMSRDNSVRVSRYAGFEIEFVRLALNMDQIMQYDPPAQPVKDGDSRSGSYRDMHGDEVWEMDALEPTVLIELIKEAIADRIDQDRLAETLKEEEIERQKLTDIADNWNVALASARGEEPEETDY
jgi:hypothetical protein